MKKTILLICGLIFAVLIVTLIAVLPRTIHKSPGTEQTTTPTPIPSVTLAQPTLASRQSLYIVTAFPLDGQKNVPTNQNIVITFNRIFSANEFSFSSSFQSTTSISGNTLIVKPTNPLKENTTYIYYVNYTSPDSVGETRSFSTIGPNPKLPDEFQGQGNAQTTYSSIYGTPDLFLSNHTPYKGKDFSVTYDFTTTPNEHFYFTVTLSGSNHDQAKQDFLNWLTSLGFSDAQIQSLDIRYQ